MAKVKLARSKGCGNVYKVGNLYYARWTVNGKKYTAPTHCTKKEDALKILEQKTHPFIYKSKIGQLEHIKAELTIEAGKEDEYQKLFNRIKIEDIIYNVLKIKDLPDDENNSSSSFYIYALKKIVNWIKENHQYITFMDQITKEICEEFMIYLKKEKGDSAHNGNLITLKRIWNILRDKTHLDNVWNSIKPIKYVKVAKKENLSKGELDSLKEQMYKNPDDKLLFIIATNTCLRRSDCCLFKWKYIDDSFNVIRLIPYKTRRFNEILEIPITNELKIELMRQKAITGDNEYVLPHLAKLYHTKSIRCHLANIFKKAGIERFNDDGIAVKGFHSLRVWCISNMLKNGIPLATVQKIAGHFDHEMTMRYYRMDFNDTVKALDSLKHENEEKTDTVSISKEEYEEFLKFKAEKLKSVI